MIRRTEPDPRIVYGATCAWWDGIEKIGRIEYVNPITRNVSYLPCCPICRGMLFEMPDAASWWAAVDKHDKAQPGYRAFVEWQRGKHFADLAQAEAAYELSGDKKHRDAERIKGLRS